MDWAKTVSSCFPLLTYYLHSSDVIFLALHHLILICLNHTAVWGSKDLMMHRMMEENGTKMFAYVYLWDLNGSSFPIKFFKSKMVKITKQNWGNAILLKISISTFDLNPFPLFVQISKMKKRIVSKIYTKAMGTNAQSKPFSPNLRATRKIRTWRTLADKRKMGIMTFWEEMYLIGCIQVMNMSISIKNVRISWMSPINPTSSLVTNTIYLKATLLYMLSLSISGSTFGSTFGSTLASLSMSGSQF